MANTKITTGNIADGSITSAKLDTSSLAIPSTATATTQTAGDNSNAIATTAYVETAVSNLVDSSPAALDTLNELAAALGDDANFSTTVTNSLALKAPLASPSFTGSVGIGTSNPVSNLHISGAANNTYLRIDDGTEFLNLGVDGNGIFYNTNTTHRFLSNSGTIEALTIDTSGNVGIGVTPSSSGYKNLQINTTGIIGSNTGYVWFGNNWVYNGGDKYIANGYATLYGSNEGKHTWFVAPSGTAGNAISFVEAMTINNSGRVGIGEASTGANLHVIGESSANATNDFGMLDIEDGSDNGISFGFDTTNTRGFIYSRTRGIDSRPIIINNALTVTRQSQGFVGIGTTSPDVQLEVAGSSGSSSAFKLSGRPDWTSGSGQYNVGNIYGENLGAGVVTTRIKLDGDDTSGSMIFYTAASGTLQPALVLDNTQDVTFYGSTSIPLGDRYYGQIKARTDMYVTSYGGGAGNTNKGLLVSGGNTNENSWIFIDSANPAWGIYHRNTDSTETYSTDEPLRPNSWAWIGNGRLSGYITLENKTAGVTTEASYVRGGLAGVYHDFKFKSDSGFEIGKGDDGEPVHTPTINERSSATNAVNSTVGNGGPGVYWLNFNGKTFRAYVRPNWLQGRNWILAAKWFSATDMPSGSAYWTNDEYHNEGDFNPYSGLWSKYLAWRYFSFDRLAMQMGDRIAPIMQFSSSQTLYGAFSGGRASNGGGVTASSTDPQIANNATYHSMTNFMGPAFTDMAGSEDIMQSYGLNKWANSALNSTSSNNNGSAALNSNVSQGFQLTVEDAHNNIGGIPSQGVAGAWIGCPMDEGGFTFGGASSNAGADSGFGFGMGCGNNARTSTSGIAEWGTSNKVANYLPAYVWLSLD